MTHPCVDDGYAADACEERTKLRPAWRAFDIGLAPARARRSSPPLDVVAGRPLSLSRPLGSVRLLRICIHSSPGRWYTARVVCVLSILQYGLPRIVTVLVLPTDYTESVLCLCPARSSVPHTAILVMLLLLSRLRLGWAPRV
jgi:hypothetical protein